MKSFMAKLKSMNYKEFALQHGEKIGFGLFAMVALGCLAMTTWSSELTISPDDMETVASKVEKDLKSKAWPETEKAQFWPPKLARDEIASATAPVDLMKYEWGVDFSPKLYERAQPRSEVAWLAPTLLRARFGTMPMGTLPPPPASESTDDDKEKDKDKKKPAKKPSRKSGSSGDDLLSEPVGMGMSGSGYAGAGGIKARGVRFNVVVGVVPVQEQYKRIQKALNLESLAQASQYLEYLDFKVQRQRAVPGADPWTAPWTDLSYDSSIDTIAQASDLDLEIVDQKYTDQVLTSALPHRLDVDWWDPNLVGHDKIPTLTEDQQEQQDALNRKALEVVGDDPSADKTKRRGFARLQKDAKSIRSAALNDSGDGGRSMQEMMRKMPTMGGGGAAGPMAMGSSMDSMMRTMPSGASDGGGMRGRGSAGAMNRTMPPMGRGMGAMSDMAGMGGMGGGMSMMDSKVENILFRYFDFDVEPGECYRYRVQVIVKNPSFGEAFVASPSVAEGETRESPWSEPSTAAAVDRDISYALSKVPPRPGRYDGADLEVVQFDPEYGTLLTSTFKVPFGSYVSAMVKKCLRLDLPAQSLEEADVKFSSKDVLLDSAPAPNLSATAAADLKLDTKQLSSLRKNGELELAVTVDRFGEIQELDALSRYELEPARKRVKEERADYEAARAADKEAKKQADKADDASGRQGGRGRRRSRDAGQNPMRSGGSMGDMMRNMPGGMTTPGGGGQSPRRGGGRAGGGGS